MKDVVRRMDTIDAKIRECAKNNLSFEQFQVEWKKMDDLSRNLYIAFAECPELLGEPDKREKQILGHLEQMGLVKEHYILQGGEIVRKT